MLKWQSAFVLQREFETPPSETEACWKVNYNTRINKRGDVYWTEFLSNK
jgi:hypothetical protein